jgi:hypothetical protein
MSAAQHNPYAEEARERWGDTEAYRQSEQRAARYTEQDWRDIKAASGAVTEGLARAMRSGQPADSAAAMDLAEEHRQQISRYFYDCGYDIHRGLGDMYVADPRFTAVYEQVAPGLAQYLRDAIHANAARAR